LKRFSTKSSTENRPALKQRTSGTPATVHDHHLPYTITIARRRRRRNNQKANTTFDPLPPDSEVSDDDEDYMPDESFSDRLSALKDIVPPTYRKHLSNSVSTTSSWVQTTLNYGGKTLWVVSTSILLLGVPWALAFAEEQQMAEMEREMKMQQSANEVCFHPSEDENS
jgi:import receptor subunit TOM22